VDLDKAGVDDRVIDLMVALSFPRSFAIRPSGPDDRLTPFPPLYPGADFIDAAYDYPYLYGPYYSNYYYSPYFFSPFGYSYLRYYGGGFAAPYAVIVPGDGTVEADRATIGRPRTARAGQGIRLHARSTVAIRPRRAPISGARAAAARHARAAHAAPRRPAATPPATPAAVRAVPRAVAAARAAGGSSAGPSSGSSGGDSGRTAVPK
jgi:hypothetical protein